MDKERLFMRSPFKCNYFFIELNLVLYFIYIYLQTNKYFSEMKTINNSCYPTSIILIIVWITSCQSNSILEQGNELYVPSDTCSFTFTYKGETYEYDETKNYNKISNTIRSAVQNNNAFYHELQRTIPELCAVVKEDGNLELYDSLEEFFYICYSVENSHIQSKNNKLLAYSVNPEVEGRITLYDREFFVHYGDNVPIGKNHFDIKIKYEKDCTWYNTDMPFQGGQFEKLKAMSFIFDYLLKGVWPDRSILQLILFKESGFSGQCLVYEESVANSLNPRGSITEIQLSRIGWANRIKAVRTQLLIPTPIPRPTLI